MDEWGQCMFCGMPVCTYRVISQAAPGECDTRQGIPQHEHGIYVAHQSGDCRPAGDTHRERVSWLLEADCGVHCMQGCILASDDSRGAVPEAVTRERSGCAGIAARPWLSTTSGGHGSAVVVLALCLPARGRAVLLEALSAPSGCHLLSRLWSLVWL